MDHHGPQTSILGIAPDERLTACPICQSSDALVITREGVLYNRFEERTTLVSNLCLSCAVIYTNPRLSRATLRRFYQSEQAERLQRQSLAALVAAPVSAKTARRVEFALPFLKSGARILEVGSGECRVVAALTKRLPDAHITGLEPSLDGDSVPLPNLRLIADRIDDTWMPPNLSPPYDCVVAFHVLEHQHAPVQFLEQLGNTLSPGGLLYLEVPNTYRPFWMGNGIEIYFKRVHLFSYGQRSLEFLLRKSGFVPVQWDESETRALRVISRRHPGEALHAAPRPIQRNELTIVRRYFALWKTYSVWRRTFPLSLAARPFASLVWPHFRRNLAAFA